MKLFSKARFSFSYELQFCRKAAREPLHRPHVDAVALHVVLRIQVVAHLPNHQANHHGLGQDRPLEIETDHIAIKDVTKSILQEEESNFFFKFFLALKCSQQI